MLDINYVRENAPEVTKAAVSKQRAFSLPLPSRTMA